MKIYPVWSESMLYAEMVDNKGSDQMGQVSRHICILMGSHIISLGLYLQWLK